MPDHVLRQNITMRPDQKRRLEWLRKYYRDMSQSAVIRRLIDRDYQSIQEAKKEKS